MGWNAGELEWIATATTGAALLLVGGARFAVAVRCRQHRDLIADALERMRAQVPEPVIRPRLRTLSHDLAGVLARQDRAAAALRAKNAPAAGSTEDFALLISVEAVTAFEAIGEEKVDDGVWEEAAVAPSVSEHPKLKEITARMGRANVRLIDLGWALLGEGQRLGLLEEGVREPLAAALEQARLAVYDSERLAESGAPLAALAALTALHIPVPESGFPGQLVTDELRVQVNALARLGIRHRAALSEYREAEIQKERR